MAVVELLLPAEAAHVRTARLVVVMAARRAGLSDALLDELRLAVGEACARAVGLHTRHGLDERVEVAVTDDVTGLTVSVTDHGPAAGPAVDDVTGGILHEEAGDGEDAVDPDVSLAVLAGLVDEVEVTARDAGTTVTMRWPLAARIPGAPKPTVDAPA